MSCQPHWNLRKTWGKWRKQSISQCSKKLASKVGCDCVCKQTHLRRPQNPQGPKHSEQSGNNQFWVKVIPVVKWEKVFVKIQHPFLYKHSQQFENGKELPQCAKGQLQRKQKACIWHSMVKESVLCPQRCPTFWRLWTTLEEGVVLGHTLNTQTLMKTKKYQCFK